jgi:hypothetical protein
MTPRDTILTLILLVGFIALLNKDTVMRHIASYAPVSQDNWWNRPVPSEGFQSLVTTDDGSLFDYPPNGPSPADNQMEHPYHLLSDVLATSNMKDARSTTTSRSCYAVDFEQSTTKTGTYRQTTNNYKRNYPDSCSGWNQDLTLNFYKPISM